MLTGLWLKVTEWLEKILRKEKMKVQKLRVIKKFDIRNYL